MSLLDGIQVACFDLYDTLIRVDTRNLPTVRLGDREIRSTIPILHEAIFEPRGIPLEQLAQAIGAMWQSLRAELQDTGPDGETWREIAATDKYRRLARDLELGTEGEIEALAAEVAELHHRTLVGSAVAVEGAAELLTRVRSRGIRTVLVSNWDHAEAGPAMLEATGLAPLLDHVVISEAIGYRKPDARIFRAALEPFGSGPDTAIHVGDLALADAWGAGRLGFRTVWINPGGEAYTESGPAPALTVARLADLLEHA